MKNKILWLSLFSIAMGFLETAVVIYLRKLYYPTGFSFPLVPIPADLALVEVLREAATLIMLVGIGILAGKNKLEKFVFFLYSFAIWDLCYYVFLKMFLNWPESLLTWDLLFLIPVPWVGPVLAPCLLSLVMILFLVAVLKRQQLRGTLNLLPKEWTWILFGCLFTLFSFLRDYFVYASESKGFNHVGEEALADLSQYQPQQFAWGIFGLGLVLILIGIGSFYFRTGPRHRP